MKMGLFTLWLLTSLAWAGADTEKYSGNANMDSPNRWMPEMAASNYYFYDYVNHPYPFTPEPIWRQMFRGMRERIEAEERVFGVPGQSAVELEYYIRAYQQRQNLWKQRLPAGK